MKVRFNARKRKHQMQHNNRYVRKYFCIRIYDGDTGVYVSSYYTTKQVYRAHCSAASDMGYATKVYDGSDLVYYQDAAPR